MDPNPERWTMHAPGLTAGVEPAEGGVEDRLVEPEVTRDEVLDGRRLVAQPSEYQHADPHCRLDYLMSAHIRRDYVASTDLLTRVAEDSDFASDTCVRRSGIDPATGGRYLEELAFEVVHRQSHKESTRRAALMIKRGVRRVFAIFVLKDRVGEFDPATGEWRWLDRGSALDDPCLIRPLAVRALLDYGNADAAVVRALEAHGEPALEELKQASERAGFRKGEEIGLRKGEEAGLRKGEEIGLRKGEEAGLRKGQISFVTRGLERRFGPLPPGIVQRLEDADLADLERWGDAMWDAASLRDIVGE